MNDDRIGEVYPSLVALLKAKSPHFATTIDKQVQTCLPGPLSAAVADVHSMPSSCSCASGLDQEFKARPVVSSQRQRGDNGDASVRSFLEADDVLIQVLCFISSVFPLFTLLLHLVFTPLAAHSPAPLLPGSPAPLRSPRRHARRPFSRRPPEAQSL
jgi:hypothetical protein